MTFTGPHAVLSRSRVVRDESRERRAFTLDETGEAAILYPAGAFANVLEQTLNRVRKWRAVTRREKFPDLFDRRACLRRLEELARFEPPNEVGGADRIGVKRQTIARFQIYAGRCDLKIGSTRRTWFTTRGADSYCSVTPRE